MSNIAISFEHVSKMYQLGVVGTGTVSNDLKRWWQVSVLGKEDPFLKVGQTNDRATKSKSDFVYALRDIDFQVEQGDVIGLIGKNGAGKSTLLKLLSRITAPTTGTIKAKGRIASLLEVGTGFHPELTGRENIYLNGSIMGMTKQEIDSKLDEIVDFSGCEMYIDTPTKRYSSGMQVRLGFAVAAFLEPEILVVDEVLAVGDAEFQKKAIGKMQDVATNGGRTVLFVSHNMNSVRALCKHGVVLNKGMVEYSGTADECVDFYMQTSIQDFISDAEIKPSQHGTYQAKELEITHATLLNDVKNMSTEEPLRLRLCFKQNISNIKRTQVGIYLHDSSGAAACTTFTNMCDLPDGKKEFVADIVVPCHQLSRGSYIVDFSLSQFDYSAVPFDYDYVHNALSFEVKYQDANHQIPFVGWQPRLGSSVAQNSTVEIH
ncbi:MAG: ABC transporter ATP-binding protein [Bacteroidales bacterium]|nr:ABC transporter ATP-binding protein [Bacteroidales bacterium]